MFHALDVWKPLKGIIIVRSWKSLKHQENSLNCWLYPTCHLLFGLAILRLCYTKNVCLLCAVWKH